MGNVIDAIRGLINNCQKEGEELSTYANIFRNISDIAVSQLRGEIILHMERLKKRLGKNHD